MADGTEGHWWNHWADNSWGMWNSFSCLHAGEKPFFFGFFLVEVELTEVISLCQPKAGTSWLLLHLGWCWQQLWAGCETLWASLSQPSTAGAGGGREQEELMGHGWAVRAVSSPSAGRLCGDGALNTMWEVVEHPKNWVLRQDGNLSIPLLAVGLH